MKRLLCRLGGHRLRRVHRYFDGWLPVKRCWCSAHRVEWRKAPARP